MGAGCGGLECWNVGKRLNRGGDSPFADIHICALHVSSAARKGDDKKGSRFEVPNYVYLAFEKEQNKLHHMLDKMCFLFHP